MHTAVRAVSLEELASHRPWMLARAYRYTGNQHDAEEAVQESFVRYIERAPPQVLNPKAYLGRVLDNVLHASRRGFNRFESATADFSTFRTERSTATPHQAYEDLERQIQVREALSDLKPRHRRVLLLLSEGLTPKEIAPILGISSHAVNALQLRARLNLRMAMLKKGFVQAFVPFCKMRERIASWVEGFRHHPADALALIVALAVLPVAIAIVPSYPLPPATDENRTVAPAIREDRISGLPQIETIHTSPSAGVPNPAGRSKETVVHWEGPSTTIDIEGEGQDGPPEPSVQEQLLSYLKDPGSFPLPDCEGIIDCPSS